MKASGFDSKGNPTAVTYDAKEDGQDYQIGGVTDADKISLERLDTQTVMVILKKAGNEIGREQCEVSKDGKSLRVTTLETTADGHQLDNALWFDKKPN
jgi:hypothetical protein